MSEAAIATADNSIRTFLGGGIPDFSTIVSPATGSAVATALLNRVHDLLDITDLVNNPDAFAALAGDPDSYEDLDTGELTFADSTAQLGEELANAIDGAHGLGDFIEEPAAALVRSTRLIFIGAGDEARFTILEIDPQSSGGVSFYAVDADVIESALIALAAIAARLVQSVVGDEGYDDVDAVFAEFN
jgi:hypothetical protein